MRLRELDPRWYGWYLEGGRIGLTFECPVHRGTPQAHRCAVPFTNPIEGRPETERRHLWHRTGDSFDTLTLSPSVDYTRYDNGELRDPTCWHGFVRNGEVS